MKCPKCQEDDIIVAVKAHGPIYLCAECCVFWNDDMEVLGEMPERQVDFYKNIIEWNTYIDEIDFQLAESTDTVKCIFCDKLAVMDGDDYKCHSCGGSWSVI